MRYFLIRSKNVESNISRNSNKKISITHSNLYRSIWIWTWAQSTSVYHWSRWILLSKFGEHRKIFPSERQQFKPSVIFLNDFSPIHPLRNVFHSGITGGPVSDEYQFLQFHMHWGSNELEGSEHVIDGVRYPGEVSSIRSDQILYSVYNRLELVTHCHLECQSIQNTRSSGCFRKFWWPDGFRYFIQGNIALI